MKRIINFSGGKSSALMTILEYNPETDYVVFCDTGREHEKTYKFINDFEAFENIPIIRLGSKDSFTKYLGKRDFE
jgi:3'-phosphoadenosine 5'-phosphosulfate sulfotransferase (PAPS reductase)/FAD synthetase